jgi:hypothetical protein
MTDLVDERMDDRMDQRLAAAARRWQAEQPPPPGVPLDRLGDPTGHTVSRRAMVAVAAAVVLVCGVGIGILRATGGDSSEPTSRPTPSTTVHGKQVAEEVVPWRELKSRHPKIGHDVHGTLVTPYDGIVATGHIGGDLHPGDTLVFTVTLESATPVALHPCPDYSIAFGRHAFVTRQLNCTQVPYYASAPGPHGRMGDFGPTLPANTPVSFRMRMTVPDEPGRQKVLWTLDGPESSPGFYGIVRVTPRG